MTERQAKQVRRELRTESWSFVGFATDDNGDEDESCKVYQTHRNELFAISTTSGKVFFEVEEDNGIFTVY